MQFGFRKGSGGGHGRGAGRRGGAGQGRGQGFGLENCVCPTCGATVPHQRGIPCFQTTCPSCGIAMTRQFQGWNTPPLKQQPIVSAPATHIERPAPGGRPAPQVDPALCTGCGRCIPVCPVDVISMVDGKAVIDGANCNGCRVCVAACPESAII